jgi:hypothetical protein
MRYTWHPVTTLDREFFCVPETDKLMIHDLLVDTSRLDVVRIQEQGIAPALIINIAEYDGASRASLYTGPSSTIPVSFDGPS